jgi:hypothetical protein
MRSKSKNYEDGFEKNRAEIAFLMNDHKEAIMGATSDIGPGSGYEKIEQIETFCVDRVS